MRRTIAVAHAYVDSMPNTLKLLESSDWRRLYGVSEA
jgi:hypothetical protein